MKVGPINTFNGFPIWYKDGNDLRLQLNIDTTDPYSGISIADLPNPLLPVSFPDNYPGEAFYLQAEAEMTTGAGERARLVLALEATFVNDAPRVAEQIVFGRVRIRVDGLRPNEQYTVTHPYGIDTFMVELDRDGVGEINFTEDIGGFNGEDFELALNSRVFPFLQWDPSVAPNAPVGYIGDPNVLHPVTGSLLVDRFGQSQNYFRIEGPGIGIGSPDRSTTPGINADNCIETNNFTLLGKISTISGVDVTRATYTQSESLNGVIDVFSTSDDSAQNIEVTGTGIDPTLLQGEQGKYFSRVQFTGENPPNSITVTNITDIPESRKEVEPVDFIIATADYDTDTNTLSITAKSSDLIRIPILTVADFGFGESIIPLDGLTIPNLTFTPANVTIHSTNGGERTIPIAVSGSSGSPSLVIANAGEDETVIFDSPVTLNGLNSIGPISSYSWTQLSGIPVSLVNADSPTPSFTAPTSTTTLTFELTVDSEIGSFTDTVNINVIEFIPPPIANAGPSQTVLEGAIVTLSGSAIGEVTNYVWEQTAGPTVLLVDANTGTATFTFPNETTSLTFRLTIHGPGGSSSDLTVVTSAPEQLTVTRAEFRTRDAEWRISGTTNLIGASVVMTIFIGNALDGPILTQVPVDALGEWEYRVEGSTVEPDEMRAISIQSTSGSSLINIPLTIRR